MLYSYIVQFSRCCPLSLSDSFNIISLFVSLVKPFSKLFLRNFFVTAYCSSEQLFHYITFTRFCQAFFQLFFKVPFRDIPFCLTAAFLLYHFHLALSSAFLNFFSKFFFVIPSSASLPSSCCLGSLTAFLRAVP